MIYEDILESIKSELYSLQWSYDMLDGFIKSYNLTHCLCCECKKYDEVESGNMDGIQRSKFRDNSIEYLCGWCVDGLNIETCYKCGCAIRDDEYSRWYSNLVPFIFVLFKLNEDNDSYDYFRKDVDYLQIYNNTFWHNFEGEYICNECLDSWKSNDYWSVIKLKKEIIDISEINLKDFKNRVRCLLEFEEDKKRIL